jgi:hypothetical protein
MTLSDFAYLQIYAERHRELMAEAAHRRLAREATAGRTPWWRRPARRASRLRGRNVAPCH